MRGPQVILRIDGETRLLEGGVTGPLRLLGLHLLGVPEMSFTQGFAIPKEDALL